jgi:DNA-binding transcriptional regulator YbjK
MKTKDIILQAATLIARKGGIEAIRSRNVAELAECGTALIFYHFYTLNSLRAYVAAKAIKDNDKRIIAWLILANNGRVRHLTQAQRAAYLAALA